MALSLTNPIESRQAPLFRVILLLMSAFGAINTVGALLGPLGAPSSRLAPLLAGSLTCICPLGSLWLLRRGAFQTAVYLATSSFVLAHSATLLSIGVQNGMFLLVYTLPLTLAGLVATRRGVIATAALTFGCVAVLTLLQVLLPSTPQSQEIFRLERMSIPLDFALGTLFFFGSVISIVTFFFTRFGDALRDALTTAFAREQELARLSTTLETTVAERTAALQHALAQGEQREAQLKQTLDALQASQNTVRQLGAPILPVLAGILVAPIVGTLDNDRIIIFTEQVLHHVERYRAHTVIIDVTGAILIDADIAQALFATTGAIGYLGAEALLVGVRPEAAQALVSLGVDLGKLKAYANLQDAVSRLQPRNVHS